MGYIDDDTLAEAHGWSRDRPGNREVLANAKPTPKPEFPSAQALNELHAREMARVAQPYEPVFAELGRAVAKFPTWPTDPLHALGVLHEEVGELSKEVLQLVYEPHKTSPAKVREEAIQAAAMALRFVLSLDAYDYTPGVQHELAPDAKIAFNTQPGDTVDAAQRWL